MEKPKKRVGFTSGIGFILAAAGSAVGLGNLSQFPYKTSQNGGAAFVLVYILCVIFIGIIAMITEIYLGRRAVANPLSAYKKTNKCIGWFGLLAIAIPLIITCYYSILGGWTLKFAINSLQAKEEANNVQILGDFLSDPIEPLFYTALFIFLAVLIIRVGVKRGIEKASKILMPALFIILLFIVIYCLCLGDGVKKGLDFYILKADFSALGFEGVCAAMGQAFFSLSLGMGIMVSYGSYTGKKINLGKSAFMISLFDTIVALLAGLAIFPAIGALAPDYLNKTQGVMLIYKILPIVFQNMTGVGDLISFLFFAMVSIAAITSVMSLLEVVTQFTIQKFRTPRKKTTLILSIICFVVSIPITWSVGGAFNGSIMLSDYDILTFIDEMSNTVLMPVCAFGSCIALGWFVDKKITFNPLKTHETLKNDGLDLGWFGKFFSFMLKYVTPLLILLVEIMGIVGKIDEYGTSYWWIVGASYVLLFVLIFIYFAIFYKKDCGCNADETIINNEAKAKMEEKERQNALKQEQDE